MAKTEKPGKIDKNVAAKGAPDLTGEAEAREREAAEGRRAEEARLSRRRIWSRTRSTVLARLFEAKVQYGAETIALEDQDGKTYTYKDICRGAFGLSGPLNRLTKRGENVGVVMPTSVPGFLTFLALQVDGRVPAMLNFTAGEGALRSAIETAKIKTIVTAKAFVEKANLQKLIDTLSRFAQVVYLEDLKGQVTKKDKLRAVIGEAFPGFARRPLSPDSPGVILFTSGTEGKPKGVLLTQQNLVANVEQVREHVKLQPGDICMNPLPIFHSYGLTGGTLFPLMDGHRLVLYPSPLHVKEIPLVVGRSGTTVMFATDTFLHRYLRQAPEGSMKSVRYAVCGAEKVRDETRNLARRLFGFNVLEGYGATEAAPVIAVNQPGDIRPGTVGKLLPGIETKIEPVEGLTEGGRLLVRGPNVMAGYLDPDNGGALVPPEDGWHDTGDIVHIDGGGYLSIRGRQKRFAKIAGEMVSLAVCENCASVVWPESIHAAVIMPDPKKGEQIILLTEEPNPRLESLQDWARSHGVPEIAMPKRVLHVDDIPVLGTGKVDYASLNATAEEMVAEAEAENRSNAAE